MVAHELSPVGRFDKILLATDGSHYSAGATQVAVAMAAKSGAKLFAITVLPDPSDGVAPDLDQEKRHAADAILAAVRQAAGEAKVACEANARYGHDPYEVIVKEAKDTQADLVATDGSRSSDAACVAAARIAHCCGSPLAVLSVMVPSHGEARQAEAGQIVERVVAALKKDNIAAQGIVERGIAEEVIIETAKRLRTGLILLGSHGRTGWGRILFGSKAERVIEHATCPIMVVKAM